jgi:hypothetical protein
MKLSFDVLCLAFKLYRDGLRIRHDEQPGGDRRTIILSGLNNNNNNYSVGTK